MIYVFLTFAVSLRETAQSEQDHERWLNGNELLYLNETLENRLYVKVIGNAKHNKVMIAQLHYPSQFLSKGLMQSICYSLTKIRAGF